MRPIPEYKRKIVLFRMWKRYRATKKAVARAAGGFTESLPSLTDFLETPAVKEVAEKLSKLSPGKIETETKVEETRKRNQLVKKGLLVLLGLITVGIGPLIIFTCFNRKKEEEGREQRSRISRLPFPPVAAVKARSLASARVERADLLHKVEAKEERAVKPEVREASVLSRASHFLHPSGR